MVESLHQITAKSSRCVLEQGHVVRMTRDPNNYSPNTYYRSSIELSGVV